MRCLSGKRIRARVRSTGRTRGRARARVRARVRAKGRVRARFRVRSSVITGGHKGARVRVSKSIELVKIIKLERQKSRPQLVGFLHRQSS